MPERHPKSRKVAGILAGAVIVTATVVGFRFGVLGGRKHSGPAGSGGYAVNVNSPIASLNQSVRASDPQALAFLQERELASSDGPRRPLDEQGAAESIETLSCLRTGFPKFPPEARSTALMIACRIFDRFAVEPAPGKWVETLRPLHDLLCAGLADSDPIPRYTALAEVSKLWVWIPGRSLMPFEEQTLGEWKGALCPAVVRCLASRDPKARMAAVRCLGLLPLDSAAAPAVAYIDDTDTDVRKQTLSSFAQRGLLLTEDMLLKRLHDSAPSIREIAGLVLKTRGVSQELIKLGTLIFSPKTSERVSVIPLLYGRTDVDPVTWLMLLSRDPAEMVRLSAIKALAGHKTPPAQGRLAEMARADASEVVRAAARKLVPSADETTASLPPLPGRSSLNPKAN
jgi:hypothetical protein